MCCEIIPKIDYSIWGLYNVSKVFNIVGVCMVANQKGLGFMPIVGYMNINIDEKFVQSLNHEATGPMLRRQA